MNCKQGDLAVIVAAITVPELLGHIVEIVGPFRGPVANTDDGFTWEIKYPDGRPIVARFQYSGNNLLPTRAYADSALRPLRDNPGQDETLTWAPVPKKVEA